MKDSVLKLALFAVVPVAISGIACSGTPGPTMSGGGTSANGGSNAAGGSQPTGGVAPVVGGAANGGSNAAGGSQPTGGSNSPAGGAQSGGAPATGGNKATGGSIAATGGGAAIGGAATTGGSKNTGGATAAGGAATGGAKTGGAPATGGAAATGGSKATGGAAATGGSTSTGTCGSLNSNPFSCKFAWGDQANGTNVVPASDLNFSSVWVGYETNGGLASASATAANNACDGCTFVTNVLKASGAPLPAFYAYFIGYQACTIGGYCDCNTHAAPNLCTNGAQWIRDNRAFVLNMYAQYAKAVYAKAGSRPVIWLLEGDFVQYTYSTGTTHQTNALTYAESGQLARDITCAIKANEPNAIVAMNHSPWLATSIATGFWGAQPLDVLDLVWVQGEGDRDLFQNNGSNPTETFSWLHSLTGKKMLAETSYAGSATADNLWSTTTAANINARIASGVLGVLVNHPPSNYATAVTALNPSLNSTCN